MGQWAMGQWAIAHVLTLNSNVKMGKNVYPNLISAMMTMIVETAVMNEIVQVINEEEYRIVECRHR